MNKALEFREILKSELKLFIENKDNWRECSPDWPPCCICKRIISIAGIRLFNENGKELSFHITCINNQLKEKLIPNVSNEEFLPNNTDFNLIMQCNYCKEFKDCNFLSSEGKKEITERRKPKDLDNNVWKKEG